MVVAVSALVYALSHGGGRVEYEEKPRWERPDNDKPGNGKTQETWKNSSGGRCRGSVAGPSGQTGLATH